MRNIVSIFRLLNLVQQKKDKEQIEEARSLTKALKKGKADLTFHVKVSDGDITDIKIGNWSYNAFEK